jgi:hypothetical protein
MCGILWQCILIFCAIVNESQKTDATQVWKLHTGAMLDAFEHPGEYQRLLFENVGKKSLALEEIERDLHRSLPEHKAFQTDIGINALRRCLTAYSWRNPEIGQLFLYTTSTILPFIFETELWT